MVAGLRVFSACLLFGLVAAGPAHAVPYAFDSKRSEVRFAYSLPFSNGQGRFTGVTGKADVNDAAPERGSVDVTIDTRTLKASDSLSEGELRGSSFFSVASHPQMRFRSRIIRAKSATTYEVSGDMTVKGITRPIILHVELDPPRGAGGTRQMRATTRISRSQFDMNAYALLVGDTVQIEMRAPLVPVR